jgi:hypothetical protein
VWVTWRQHRAALIGVGFFFAVLAVLVWITGLHLHDLYGQAIACRPAGSLSCGGEISSFNGAGNFLSNGLLLQAVPVLVGVFVGAPLLAREMETGTFRYAWTQGFGRLRWTLAKLIALAVVVTVVAEALSLLFSWYYQPYFAARNYHLGLTSISPFTPGLFDLREVTLAGWTLAAFAVGALAGMLIRRVVPAIVVSLAVYGGLAFLVGGIVRQRYLSPMVTTKLNTFPLSWVLSEKWTKDGHPVSSSALAQVLQGAGPQLNGKGGVPHSVASWRYLVQHGFTLQTTYQPTSRFWAFQWIEGGWLLVLSALLIVITVRLVRRKAN